jgi:hypothetical protein
MKLISHWINGSEVKGSGGRFGEVFDPALGTQSAQVAFAEAQDIEAAVDAAQAAFPAWKDTSLAKRNSVLFNFRQLLDQRKGELAAIITEEHGKVLSDAMGEINRGLEVVDFACGLPHLLELSLPLTSQPWFQCGSSQWPSQPATRLFSSQVKKTHRVQCGLRSFSKRLVFPMEYSMSCMETRSRLMDY